MYMYVMYIVLSAACHSEIKNTCSAQYVNKGQSMQQICHPQSVPIYTCIYTSVLYGRYCAQNEYNTDVICTMVCSLDIRGKCMSMKHKHTLMS